MTEQIDLRGLSCPQPVIQAEKNMKKLGSGTFRVISDCGTSRSNLHRLARDKGWSVTEEENEEGDFVLTLSR